LKILLPYLFCEQVTLAATIRRAPLGKPYSASAVQSMLG